MKKLFFTLVLGALCFAACHKTDLSAPEPITNEPQSLETTRHIGDPNRKPDLAPIELEYRWRGYFTEGFGIRMQRWLSIKKWANGYMYVHYACPLGNVADTASSLLYPDGSANDFVVDRSNDGIIDTVYSVYNYQYPGMISIRIYQGGQRLFTTLKQDYWVVNTNHIDGYEFYPRTYRGDTMYISAMSADFYVNYARLPSTVPGTADAGKYVVVVEVNPEKIVTESNYDNNIGTLPFRVENNLPILDLTAIAENKPVPVTNLTAVKKLTGNPKTVTLTWQNNNGSVPRPDDVYEVWENGQFKAKVLGGTYVSTVSGSWKQSTYSVFYKIAGLGISSPVSITVKK